MEKKKDMSDESRN